MTRLILLGTLFVALLPAKDLTADKRMQHAVNTLAKMAAAKDNGIPRALIGKAHCIVIVPGLLKGAFLFGGEYGRGFASCRKPGGWTAPAAVKIEGGSFGSQLGASSTDLIMLVMNRKRMAHLLSDRFMLGADIAVVNGTAGRAASVNADLTGRASILTYSLAKGLFSGISLEGATLHTDSRENQKLYGRPMNNKQILETRVATPPAARPLVLALNKLARRA